MDKGTNYVKKNNIYMALAVVAIAILFWFVFNPPNTRAVVGQSSSLPGAYSNPDTNRNIYEIIESRGFKAQPHFVTTNDGYILQLIRIVNPYVPKSTSLKPIVLFHGFQCTGTLWIVASNGTLKEDGHYYEFDENNNLINASVTTGNTLGFVLASKGYDVWLANYRGSLYSSNHTHLNVEDPKFWSFSIDEMISIDLPALIDYVRTETKHQTISYIGHSQGSFMMFGLLSKDQKYSKVIKPFIALSPVFYLHKTLTPLRYFSPFRDILRSYPSSMLGSVEARSVYYNLCENIYLRKLCYMIYSFFLGSPEKDMNMDRLGVYMANVPMGSSTWNTAHFLQMLQHGNPAHFDYGDPTVNLQKYGSETPPFYNVSEVDSSDIALIYTKNDWFNHLDNIEHLKNNLKVKLIEDYSVPDDTWNHMELVWAKEVGQYVNTKILNILAQY